MNEKIKMHLIKYCEEKGWTHDDDKDLIETLLEANEIWSGNDEEHRHWIEYDAVVEINGMFIQFGNAKGAGDQGPIDAGWEFDPNTICEVEEKKKTVTTYVPKV